MRRPKLAVVAFVVSTTALVALASCSNSGEPGACFRETEGTCVQYGRPQGAAGKRMCDKNKWIAGEKACPTEKRLGLCTHKGDKAPEYLYGGPPNNYTSASARNHCDFAGGFFEPAGASSAK
jgi:hypothetical protein